MGQPARLLDPQAAFLVEHGQCAIIEPDNRAGPVFGDNRIHFAEHEPDPFDRPASAAGINDMHAAVDGEHLASCVPRDRSGRKNRYRKYQQEAVNLECRFKHLYRPAVIETLS